LAQPPALWYAEASKKSSGPATVPADNVAVRADQDRFPKPVLLDRVCQLVHLGIIQTDRTKHKKSFPVPRVDIPSFDDARCRIIEDTKPEVVSFHFGLPDSTLLARVKDVGCRIMASATTVAEAVWLETRGVDIIIAQGYEAGGHRGTFLAQSSNSASSSQPGTLALVPQVVDAVNVPVGRRKGSQPAF
jgi:NAD(P)H-dependent flavin oxidoreductase YrpB (nitropropane dioxygenase family)